MQYHRKERETDAVRAWRVYGGYYQKPTQLVMTTNETGEGLRTAERQAKEGEGKVGQVRKRL